jgi:hypothetical protein
MRTFFAIVVVLAAAIPAIADAADWAAIRVVKRCDPNADRLTTDGQWTEWELDVTSQTDAFRLVAHKKDGTATTFAGKLSVFRSGERIAALSSSTFAALADGAGVEALTEHDRDRPGLFGQILESVGLETQWQRWDAFLQVDARDGIRRAAGSTKEWRATAADALVDDPAGLDAKLNDAEQRSGAEPLDDGFYEYQNLLIERARAEVELLDLMTDLRDEIVRVTSPTAEAPVTGLRDAVPLGSGPSATGH